MLCLSGTFGLGGTWGLLEGVERLGCENPSTSTRTPSTLTLVGERLEDDESSSEVAVFKGPTEPFWCVSLTHPKLVSFLSGEFLRHIPWWLPFYMGSFSYTSRAGFFSYLVRFSNTSHAGFFSYLGRFSYTSRAGFTFILGVSLTHPMLASFLTSGDSLTQALLLSWEYLLHIPCWLYFAVGSFSYTYPSYLLFFNMGVSVTHNNNNNLFYIAPQQQLYELLALYTSTNAIEHTSICYLN